MPDWAARVAAENPADGPALARPVTLRPSAVLILTPRPGPPDQVLLTERATDLGDYPGRVKPPEALTTATTTTQSPAWKRAKKR